MLLFLLSLNNEIKLNIYDKVFVARTELIMSDLITGGASSGVARIWCEGGTGRGAEGLSPSPLGVGSVEGAVPPPQKIF